MKKILFLFFFSFLFIKCSKDNPQKNTEIKDVTEFVWQIFRLQKPEDIAVVPNPSNWHFILNKDGSFSSSFQGFSGSGTYSWIQVDSSNAKVNFKIQKWNSTNEYRQYVDRLKQVLEAAHSCRYLKHPYLLSIPYYSNDPLMELNFYGSAGELYVFRL